MVEGKRNCRPGEPWVPCLVPEAWISIALRFLQAPSESNTRHNNIHSITHHRHHLSFHCCSFSYWTLLTFPTIPSIARIAYSEQLWVPRPICSTTGQQLGFPTLPHQKDVLVPHPESIHQIHPRFRGERHPGLEESGMVALVQIGAFVGYVETSA